MKQTGSQQHLGSVLDTQLNFQEHLKTVFAKLTKPMGLIHKLKYFLRRPSLLTLNKSFVRPHLDYGDVIFDHSFNNSLQNKIKSIQYKASLAITRAIRETLKEKFDI